LTLKSGYSVVELPVLADDELAHKTVKESGLRANDILVLSIMRGSITIPNPRSYREILPGDTLLCFGKLLALKSLMPPRREKKEKRRSAKLA
jgi:ribosomal protein S6--L-glutamate ligase